MEAGPEGVHINKYYINGEDKRKVPGETTKLAVKKLLQRLRSVIREIVTS